MTVYEFTEEMTKENQDELIIRGVEIMEDAIESTGLVEAVETEDKLYKEISELEYEVKCNFYQKWKVN